VSYFSMSVTLVSRSRRLSRRCSPIDQVLRRRRLPNVNAEYNEPPRTRDGADCVPEKGKRTVTWNPFCFLQYLCSLLGVTHSFIFFRFYFFYRCIYGCIPV
jgi:hypothetical protein